LGFIEVGGIIVAWTTHFEKGGCTMKKEYKCTIVAENGTLSISEENVGFTSLELIGLFTYKIRDIEKQMAGEIHPDIEKRKAVKPIHEEKEVPND
jgi:hypothetical protein